MAGSSNSSFIPKRGPAARKRKNPTHRIYIFSLVSYILMFSALLASGAVFLYGSYIDRLFAAEVQAFSKETQSFDETQMLRISEFEKRLNKASEVFDSSFSIATIFDLIEGSTAESVQFKSVEISKTDVEGSTISVKADVVTDSYDSAIFQREFYEQSSQFDNVVVSGITHGSTGGGEGSDSVSATEATSSGEDEYTFTLEFDIDDSELPLKTIEDNDEVLTISPVTQEEGVPDASVETVEDLFSGESNESDL